MVADAEEEKPLECSFCDYRSFHKENMRDHVRVHEKKMCRVCGKAFRFQRAFEAHMEEHSEEERSENARLAKMEKYATSKLEVDYKLYKQD